MAGFQESSNFILIIAFAVFSCKPQLPEGRQVLSSTKKLRPRLGLANTRDIKWHYAQDTSTSAQAGDLWTHVIQGPPCGHSRYPVLVANSAPLTGSTVNTYNPCLKRWSERLKRSHDPGIFQAPNAGPIFYLYGKTGAIVKEEILSGSIEELRPIPAHHHEGLLHMRSHMQGRFAHNILNHEKKWEAAKVYAIDESIQMKPLLSIEDCFLTGITDTRLGFRYGCYVNSGKDARTGAFAVFTEVSGYLNGTQSTLVSGALSTIRPDFSDDRDSFVDEGNGKAYMRIMSTPPRPAMVTLVDDKQALEIAAFKTVNPIGPKHWYHGLALAYTGNPNGSWRQQSLAGTPGNDVLASGMSVDPGTGRVYLAWIERNSFRFSHSIYVTYFSMDELNDSLREIIQSRKTLIKSGIPWTPIAALLPTTSQLWINVSAYNGFVATAYLVADAQNPRRVAVELAYSNDERVEP